MKYECGALEELYGQRKAEKMGEKFDLKVWHSRCFRSIIQSCSVYISYIYIYIYIVMKHNNYIKLVAKYNIQIHVSALYVGPHQVV